MHSLSFLFGIGYLTGLLSLFPVDFWECMWRMELCRVKKTMDTELAKQWQWQVVNVSFCLWRLIPQRQWNDLNLRALFQGLVGMSRPLVAVAFRCWYVQWLMAHHLWLWKGCFSGQTAQNNSYWSQWDPTGQSHHHLHHLHPVARWIWKLVVSCVLAKPLEP